MALELARPGANVQERRVIIHRKAPCQMVEARRRRVCSITGTVRRSTRTARLVAVPGCRKYGRGTCGIDLGSPEYLHHAGGTIGLFATALYHDVLGRTPSSADLVSIQSLHDAGWTQEQIAHVVFTSPESVGDRFTSLYQHFLRRNPTGAEITEFSGILTSNLGQADLLAMILATDEYFASTQAA